jgi:hypothetical protein
MKHDATFCWDADVSSFSRFVMMTAPVAVLRSGMKVLPLFLVVMAVLSVPSRATSAQVSGSVVFRYTKQVQTDFIRCPVYGTKRRGIDSPSVSRCSSVLQATTVYGGWTWLCKHGRIVGGQSSPSVWTFHLSNHKKLFKTNVDICWELMSFPKSIPDNFELSTFLKNGSIKKCWYKICTRHYGLQLSQYSD